MLILRYYENLDTPKISFKVLNGPPDDMYPVLTICFEGYPKPHYIYQETNIPSNLKRKDYHFLLKGKKEAWKKKAHDMNITGIDFNIATNGNRSDGKSFFLRHRVTYSNGLNETNVPFYRTYQIPGTICFSRPSEVLRKDLSVIVEYIAADLTNAEMLVFIHYPGQVMRTVFSKERKFKSILRMNKNDLTENKTTHMNIRLSQMNVVKRRPNGVITCNPIAQDDDSKFWDTLFGNITCLPPYWKNLTGILEKSRTYGNLQECNNEVQLKELNNLVYPQALYDHRKIKDIIISSFIPSCYKMTIDVNIKEKDLKKYSKKDPQWKNAVVLRLYFEMEEYQEIKNERDFGLEMLLSSIGGFIGMFIGFGLLQTLDYVLDCVLACKT